jgi:hypothetical protein
MLSIEYEPPRDQGPCPCCGGRTVSLTRFVYKSGNAHAVYLATYSDNHPQKLVSIAAGIGGWGYGSTPDDRVTFSMELKRSTEGFAVSVINSTDSPWPAASFLGRPMTRDEALASPLIREAFHLADHIVLEDEPIKSYLAAQ